MCRHLTSEQRREGWRACADLLAELNSRAAGAWAAFESLLRRDLSPPRLR